MPKVRIRTDGAEFYVESAPMLEPTEKQWNLHCKEQSLEAAFAAYVKMKAVMKSESKTLIEEII